VSIDSSTFWTSSVLNAGVLPSVRENLGVLTYENSDRYPTRGATSVSRKSVSSSSVKPTACRRLRRRSDRSCTRSASPEPSRSFSTPGGGGGVDYPERVDGRNHRYWRVFRLRSQQSEGCAARSQMSLSPRGIRVNAVVPVVISTICMFR
jgi:hypothetical protein